ncbi:MAG TPA: class E sortase [Rubrobacteraceae bacterium]|jgi:sortase A|nr:class E sortase [Rubrobacteraceae bacterium]
MKKLQTKNVISWILSLTMIAAGVALIASFFLAGSLNSAATNSEDPGGFNVPKLDTADGGATSGPKDKTLKLTIPRMSQLENDPVPTVPGTNVQALGSHAAIHLAGTGFPWDEEANVYLAGHRLGYPRTDSFLSFFDLNNLEAGDKIYITDANGTKYTYEVFKEFTVSPTDLSVTQSEPDKNILTLQTCTLPDYSQRLIVQAELVETA